MYRNSLLKPILHLGLALWSLSNLPSAHADSCYRDGFGNLQCNRTFNVAWLGIAIAVFFIAVVLGSYARYKKRQRTNVANLAYIANSHAQQATMNNQAQWQAQNQAYVPPYPQGGGYDPTNVGAYQTPPGELPKYPPPPGPPYQTPQPTGSYPYPNPPVQAEPTPGAEYQPPQYPPPTYAAKA